MPLEQNNFMFSKDSSDRIPLDDYIEKLKKIIKFKSKSNSNIHIGYTYLGQMIAHELAPSTTFFKNGENDNFSTVMDLKSIYDYSKLYSDNNECFTPNDFFYENGEFITQCVKSKQRSYLDLVRYDNGKYLNKAIIPDLRNDENIIISQLHLVFQRIHNKINNLVKPLNKNLIDKINVIRRYVVYIFHQIVKNEYLNEICHEDVYSFYMSDSTKLIYNNHKPMKKIPYEFSRAALRFGHSMVRNKYTLNNIPTNTLDFHNLFLHDGQKNIQNIHQIHWDRLFHYPGKRLPQRAKKINNEIEKIMENIPNHPTCHNNIVEINLKANYESRVLSGPEIEKIIFDLYKSNNNKYIEPINAEININQYLQNEISHLEEKYKLKIPLWAYILIEAKYRNDDKSKGLGLIGSTINCEVIFESIRQYKMCLYHTEEINKFIFTHILAKDKKLSDLKMYHLLKFIGE